MAHKWVKTGREKSERRCTVCGVVQRRERVRGRYYGFRPKVGRCVPVDQENAPTPRSSPAKRKSGVERESVADKIAAERERMRRRQQRRRG